MSSVSGGAKTRSTSTSSISGNMTNLADLEGNVQKSSLVSGIISDVRPGGDVIIETENGSIRANCDIEIAEGDNAKVRITTTKDGETTAEIISSSSEEESSKYIESKKPSFMGYLKNIISGDRPNILRNYLPASFSYISPNLKVLDYGHIKPGDKLKVEIIAPEEIERKTHIINGSVISNDGKSLMVNTEIGILNISAKSNIEPGQKILINMLEMPGADKSEAIKEMISKLMSNVSQNIELLKKILEASKSATSRTGYKNLLKLYLSPHDSALLAKIFHQSSEIPAGEVAQWIEQDIVTPFKNAAKNHRLGSLNKQMDELKTELEEAYIIPKEEWKELHIPLPDGVSNGCLKVKKSDKFIQFKLDIMHSEYKEIKLNGMIEMNMTNNSVTNMRLSVIHQSTLPEMLVSNLKSIFDDHIATSNIEGSLEFQSHSEQAPT